jgi:hypothetical protein
MAHCSRQEIEESMRSLVKPADCVDINSVIENVCSWWSDFLSWCRVNHEKYAIEFSSLVHQTKDYLAGFEDALMRDHKIRVPEFSDLNGLHALLHSKMNSNLHCFYHQFLVCNGRRLIVSMQIGARPVLQTRSVPYLLVIKTFELFNPKRVTRATLNFHVSINGEPEVYSLPISFILIVHVKR